MACCITGCRLYRVFSTTFFPTVRRYIAKAVPYFKPRRCHLVGIPVSRCARGRSRSSAGIDMDHPGDEPVARRSRPRCPVSPQGAMRLGGSRPVAAAFPLASDICWPTPRTLWRNLMMMGHHSCDLSVVYSRNPSCSLVRWCRSHAMHCSVAAPCRIPAGALQVSMKLQFLSTPGCARAPGGLAAPGVGSVHAAGSRSGETAPRSRQRTPCGRTSRRSLLLFPPHNSSR